MANPQQPELRRSEHIPALSPDAAAAKIEAARKRESLNFESRHHVGESNVDDNPQDKPDLDDFAEKLGMYSEPSS